MQTTNLYLINFNKLLFYEQPNIRIIWLNVNFRIFEAQLEK